MSEINETVTSQIEYINMFCEAIKPLVAIRCITYNHEPYIRDALEGFVMQKTDFPFVAIVHDDASTDGTAKIIREYAEKYPDIIKPIYETENQYSKHDGSLGRIMNEACNATGAEYIAMCEGDDYWTDPLKLQKQVDFLESHPDYGMCYTKARRYKQEDCKFIDVWGGPFKSFETLLEENTVPTLTVVLRSKIQRQYSLEIKPGLRKWKMGDYPIWLYFAYNSKIKFMPEVTSVYRILNNSASHCIDVLDKLYFNLSTLEIREFFAIKYNSSKESSIKESKKWALFKIKIIKNEGKKDKDTIKMMLRFRSLKYILYSFAFLIMPKRYAINYLKNKCYW